MKINEITEAVNANIFKRGFKKTTTIHAKNETIDADIKLVATHGALPYIPGKKASESDQFRIEAYDDTMLVAWVNFEPIGDDLQAIDLVVKPEYRRAKIASAMYDFAKSLDNSISPSSKQTPDGKAFWTGSKS